MNDTSNKVKARQPRGLADRGPAELAASERMLAKIRESYELYGFEAVETPFIEYTDALGKFLPDQDRPNEGVFSFQDDDEQWLSLRYDLTAPLARYVAENYDKLAKPYRSYRAGYVFRNEKPGPGRFRQFMQFDADTVGAASVAADAEICMMAADTLEKLGIQRGDYVVKVNNRKILDGVMDSVGLSGDHNIGRRLTVLRAIDKLDRLGADGVKLLLGEGRTDASGDRTEGAKLEEGQIERIMAFAFLQAGGVHLEDVTELAPEERATRGRVQVFKAENGRENYYVESNLGVIRALYDEFGGNPLAREGIDELSQIAELTKAAGYGRDRIRIDPSVVRGLEYYTGPVFEAELTFGVVDEKTGKPVSFGSVGGGGRYDGLVGRFRNEPVPATGFSIGVSRLFAALQRIDSPIVNAGAQMGPVVVLVMDRDRVAHYQAMVARLRAEGIRAELYLGSAGMKAQMKYADRRNAPCVIIQGSDEHARGEVQIKDLIEGARAAAAIQSNEEWKSARPAQFSVPEHDMVSAVKDLLARHE